jgi:hypothetical protein
MYLNYYSSLFCPKSFQQHTYYSPTRAVLTLRSIAGLFTWGLGKLRENDSFMQCFGSGPDWIRNQAGKNNLKKEKVKKFPNKIFPRFRSSKTWLWIRIQLESVLIWIRTRIQWIWIHKTQWMCFLFLKDPLRVRATPLRTIQKTQCWWQGSLEWKVTSWGFIYCWAAGWGISGFCVLSRELQEG